MKRQSAQQVRVGIFVTLGVFLSMLVIFLLGDVSGIIHRQYSLYARFQDISGLRMGAPIYLAGINIGKVEEIRFPTKLEEKKVVVSLRISKKIQDRIRQDSRASVVTQGLLGDKAVFLTVGSADQPMLQDGEFIQAKEGLSFDNIAEKGVELVDNINGLVKNLKGVIEDVKTKESFLHALLYDSQGQKIVNDVSNVIASVNSVISQIQKGKGLIHDLIYDKSQTMVNLEMTTENFKKISQKIEEGEGSLGGLINDPTVYYDLMTLLGNANRNKLLRTVIRATLATNEKDLEGGQ